MASILHLISACKSSSFASHCCQPNPESWGLPQEAYATNLQLFSYAAYPMQGDLAILLIVQEHEALRPSMYCLVDRLSVQKTHKYSDEPLDYIFRFYASPENQTFFVTRCFAALVRLSVGADCMPWGIFFLLVLSFVLRVRLV